MFNCLYFLSIIACATAGVKGFLSENSYDVIVVGGGTAGLVAANRLSESPELQVLVIEAGYSALHDANSSFPELGGESRKGPFDWNYSSAPQIYAFNMSEPLPAGKAIGGSSVINGYVYTRAEARQIDAWEESGNEGWNWQNLFPYYKKSEKLIHPDERAVEAGASYDLNFHGFTGPLHTGWSRHQQISDFLPALNHSYQELGVASNPDPAGGATRGLNTHPKTITPGNATTQDTRADAGRSYYYPFQNRGNLHMMSGTTALRVLWSAESNDGSVVAKAVEVLKDSGEKVVVSATREVIVACGSYRTPPLLEYSGIGNPAILSKYGINVVVDLPGVGENLMDQTENVLYFNASGSRNYTGQSSIVSYLTIADLYGPDAAAFATRVQAALPSYAAAIAAGNNNATSAANILDQLKIQHSLLFSSPQTPAMEHLLGASRRTLHCELWGTTPFARGNVHIQSPDPSALPRIDLRYWMFDADLELQIRSARFIRKLFLETSPLKDLVLSEGSPGLDAVPEDADDELWGRWLKKHMRSGYHPVGSAMMLPREKGGVVNSRCRVHGTENVRVVDASVFTGQTVGHTSSTVYAVAERCSDLIKEDLDLPR